jgi:hypothetical protein
MNGQGASAPAPRRWSRRRHGLSLPPKLTYGEINWFTLQATRTILSDGGEELVEPARPGHRVT